MNGTSRSSVYSIANIFVFKSSLHVARFNIALQQQALQQRAIDAQRGEFQRALGYGPQQIGLLQAGMGTPLVTTTQTGQQKTGLGDILGTGAQLLGMKFLT